MLGRLRYFQHGEFVLEIEQARLPEKVSLVEVVPMWLGQPKGRWYKNRSAR